MTGAMVFTLMLASMGFWGWISSSTIVFMIRIFNPNAFKGVFTYTRSFAVFAIPFVAFIVAAVIAKAG